MSKEMLRKIPLFTGLSDADFDELYRTSHTLSIPAGTLLIEEHAPGDAMYAVMDGDLEVTKHSPKEELVLNRLGPGDIVGEMALLENAPRNASVRALKDSIVVRVSQAAFQGLVSNNSQAMLAILRTVTGRLRTTEVMLRQSEKMTELGKLAAGLAHELNNPAAAARRSARLMGDSLNTWIKLDAQLHTLQFNSQQVETRNGFSMEMGARASAQRELSSITRSDYESDLQDWLEQLRIDQAWEIAPVLVAGGWTAGTLQAATAVFNPQQLPIVLQWLGAGYAVFGLLNEVGMSAERISEIVKAVKQYSYMDQAPILEVNVHDGLDNTLVILRHKLKAGVTVFRDYAKDLPRIEAYASELNQVWTNIIDNAVDAMQGQGELRLHTYTQDKQVVVELCDNGPGIPADVLPHIFDSFFTTKAIGVGTGLGLHIASNIVVNKHHGLIKVESQPGKTCFRVMLPLRIERE